MKNPLKSPYFRIPLTSFNWQAPLILLISLTTLISLWLYFFPNSAEAAPWSTNHAGWAKRKQLTLTNNSGSTINANTPYQITIDTKSNSPQTAGDFQSDCDDLRVVYQPDSSTFTELARAYHIAQGATSCTDSGGTIVTFPLQASITNGSSSTSYYLYYANPSASSPSNSALSAYNFSSKTATFVAPFNGTTTALAAGTATPTTATGAIRYSGNKGSALSFNGYSAGDNVSVSNTSSIQDLPNEDFTTDFWLYYHSPVNSSFEIVNKNNSGATIGWRISIANPNRIRFQVVLSSTSLDYQTASNSLTTGQWHHVSVNYKNSSKTAQIFINGNETSYAVSTAGSGSYTSDSAQNLNIASGASNSGNHLVGFIDEFRISNVTRQSATFTPPVIPLVRDSSTKVLYHFDENGDDPRNTGKAIDDSGNANHGTITGAKYVSGLIGVDNSTGSTATGTGNSPIQSYAGHQGIFTEPQTTNNITNPSFEASTYDTGWTAAGSNLTATVNTSAPFYKFGAQSEKLVADADAISGTSNMRTISINVGSTSTHWLTAYVYDGTSGNVGGTVTSSIAQLVFNGTAQTTTYTNVGGGWWRLSYTAAGINGAAEYGIEVDPSKTIYVDGVQLVFNVGGVDTYADGSLGTGYSWSGTPHQSTSTRTAVALSYSATSNITTNSGTVSLWYKRNQPVTGSSTTPRLFHWGTTSTDSIELALGAFGISATLTQNSIGVSCGNSASSIDEGEWHHIVLTWTANSGGSDTCQLYKDGVSTGGGPTGQSWTFGTPVGDFGPRLSTNTAINLWGTASDYRIYNSSLSSTEVADIYNSTLASYSQTTQLKDDPALYWKMDAGQGSTANNAGTAGSTLAGTLNNTPTWQTENFCVLGKCLWFDGSNNESVSTSDNDNLDFGASDGFSVGAWVKRNGASSAINYIVSKADTSTGGYKLWMDADGDLCFGIDDDSSWGPDISACSDTNGDFDDDKWHYVTGVRDATSDTVKVYVDGLVKDSQTDPTSTTLANTNTFYVGVDRDGTSNEWLGFIDEVKVFPTILSEAQVEVQYNLGAGAVLGTNIQNMPDALSDGLVGYWKMDESSGDRADSSGNSNTAVDNNTVTSNPGKFGNAGQFTAANTEFLSVDDNASLSSGNVDYTITAWVYLDSLGTTKHIVTKQATATINDEFELGVGGANQPFFRWMTDGSGSLQTVTLDTVTTGTWYFITAYHSSSRNEIGISLNGGAFTTATASGGNDGGADFLIGSTNSGTATTPTGGATWDGRIDEVRVYKRALSTSEVSQLYNWAPGPLLYYNMDEKTGTTVYDTGSATSSNGTLNGSGSWGQGKYNGAASLDGNGDYINGGSASNIDNLTAGNFTVTGWFNYKDNGNGFAHPASKDTNGGATGWDVVITVASCFAGAGDLTFQMENGADDIRIDAIDLLSCNTWHHYAITHDSATDTAYMYINGVLRGSDSGSGTPADDSARSLNLGSQNDTPTANELFGNLDDFKIYNYSRTQAQIVEDMNAGHPAPGSPLSSAVAHWKLDEGYGTSAQDFSGNSNTLTLNTATSAWTNSGKFLKAWSGGGARRMSRISDSDLQFSATDSFAISTWYKTDSATNPSATEYLVSDTVANTDVGIGIYANTSGNLCFGIDDDGTWGPDIASCTSTDVYDGNWHHLVAIRDTVSDKTYIYIDGLEKDSDTDTTTGTLDGDNTFFVGDIDTNDDGQEFTGSLDEIKVYRFALTSDQVKLDMNRSSSEVLGAMGASSDTQPNAGTNEYCPPDSGTAVCTGPVGEWKLDEGSGTTANDSSGTGNTGTLTSGPTFVNGKFNKAVNFDGSDDYITVSDNSSLDLTTALTISAWVNPSTTGTAGAILTKWNSSGNNLSYNFVRNTNGRFFLITSSNGSGSTCTTLTDSATIDENRWTYVAVTFNAGTVVMYKDGQAVAATPTGTCPTASIHSGAASLNIGANTNGTLSRFAGKIDQARIFNYARTPAQIAWSYNKGGPVGHWKMDECQGTTINDMSGNSLSGTLTIGASGSNTAAGTCQTSGAWYDGATGKRNYSIDLDGTDDYIDVGTSSTLNLTSTLTASAWIYPTSIPSNANIVSKTDDSSNGYRFYIRSASNGIAFCINGATCSIDSKSNTLTTNAWNHVVATYNGSAVHFYVNGNFTSTLGTGSISSSSSNFLIGGGSFYFPGKIDDVKMFNYVLTATQVKTLYNEGAYRTGPTTGAP